LDENVYLIGFKNGVYNLKETKFREGKNDDNITFSTGYDYIGNYTEHKKNLLKFLEDIQPEKEEREYMLKFLSTTLCGINKLELFHILTGNGRNGKSKLAELMSLALGEYSISLPSTFLTQEQPSAEKPRPEIVRLKGKRVLILSEPGNNQKLNANFIKSLRGNDQQTVRDLWKKSDGIISFIPQFSMMLLCNEVPAFDKDDAAIWDTSRCIEFPVKFVAEPKEENEKPMDEELREKLKFWKQDFMILLLEYYRKYKEEGLRPTNKVLRYTQNVREETDIYKQYLDERTEENNTHINIAELYADFKNWLRENHPKMRNIPSNKLFAKELRRYKTVEKVKINGKVVRGVKNIDIVD